VPMEPRQKSCRRVVPPAVARILGGFRREAWKTCPDRHLSRLFAT
jgi:hypothetical protein